MSRTPNRRLQTPIRMNPAASQYLRQSWPRSTFWYCYNKFKLIRRSSGYHCPLLKWPTIVRPRLEQALTKQLLCTFTVALRSRGDNTIFQSPCYGRATALSIDDELRFFSRRMDPTKFVTTAMWQNFHYANNVWYFKLCASFRSHRWFQTGDTVRKRPIWVKIDDF